MGARSRFSRSLAIAACQAGPVRPTIAAATLSIALVFAGCSDSGDPGADTVGPTGSDAVSDASSTDAEGPVSPV